jgi:PhnB protein
MKVNQYLNFDGDAEKAFKFYRSVFGGEFSSHLKMKQAPGSEAFSEAEQNRTMHIGLPIGKDTILMASDIVPSAGHSLTKGNNLYVSIHPESKEEADRLFNGLKQGGKIEMPMEDQFWGDYFGSLVDQFGVHWMVNYNAQHTS